jgi:hypothetical protein
MAKQYLLMVDEQRLGNISEFLRLAGIQLLEVQGMNLNNEGKINVMITPIIPNIPQADIAIPAVEQPVEPLTP